MQYLTLIQQWLGHITPLTTIMFVLFMLSEVLGSVPSIKASSIYEVIKGVLASIKDSVWPKS